jgi:hypothetical protein
MVVLELLRHLTVVVVAAGLVRLAAMLQQVMYPVMVEMELHQASLVLLFITLEAAVARGQFKVL